MFHLYLSLFNTLYFVSILACNSCIIHELGALGVVRKIQVMSFLQMDNLVTVNS